MMNTTWWLETQTTENWAYVKHVFTPEECRKIRNHQWQTKTAVIQGNREDLDYRRSQIAWLDSQDLEWSWVFQRLTDVTKQINQQFWQFDLSYIESLQYTEYHSPDGHYDLHIDMMNSGIHNRKLSFTVQLTDPEEYQGGDLEFVTGLHADRAHRDQGTVILFPSYVLHKVSAVTEGARHSLVGWVCGPKFR
jgi:PKHD-type hydroxylase